MFMVRSKLCLVYVQKWSTVVIENSGLRMGSVSVKSGAETQSRSAQGRASILF